MTLNKREQMIALVAGAALACFVGYTFLLAPYLENRAKLKDLIRSAQARNDREVQLLDAQPKVAAEWKTLISGPPGSTNGGALKTIPAQASGKTQDALFTWARSARFDLQGVKPDRPVQKGDFQHIRFQLSGTGSTASTYLFLSAIEKSTLPLQVDECRITTRKEGTDELNVQLTVTTLIFSPSTTTRPAAKPQPAGDSI